ncbi:MAG: glycosyltransferase family 4 protein [Candidatus Marinimicrobia bacterium]|nr:glycosyltransferase family 4 protein [Candidatus Neomarinimicrobiota bacterium]
MHLCILTQYYPPEIGAPQARLSELAKFMVKSGHQVTVLTAMPNYPTGQVFQGYGGFVRKETRDGVSIIRAYIYPTKSVGMIPRLANYFSFVKSSLIVGLLLLPRHDVLITESPPLFLGISGYLLSRLKRAKWIFNVSDLWPESAVNLGIIGEGLPLKMSKKLERFFYCHSWLVTGQSHEIIQNINARYPDISTHHLSNGVDIEKFKPEMKSDILSPWKACKRYTAVYAGLHGIAQGLDQIVKAAIELERKAPELQIIFIGDGAEKQQLMKDVEVNGISNISFVGPQASETMPQIWASADIALVPLKQYIPGAVPSKLYEAMASSVPVMLIAEGEAAKIIKDSGGGVAIQPNQIGDIVSKMVFLLNDEKSRISMGISGRRFVELNFNRYTILKRFTQFLEGKAHD